MSFNLLVLRFELQLLNIDTEDSTYVAPHSAQTISSKQYIRNKNAERCKKNKMILEIVRKDQVRKNWPILASYAEC